MPLKMLPGSILSKLFETRRHFSRIPTAFADSTRFIVTSLNISGGGGQGYLAEAVDAAKGTPQNNDRTYVTQFFSFSF